MSALSEMDKGAPEVGEESSLLEEPILIPLLVMSEGPIASEDPVLTYEVGVMRRSLGY